MAERTSTENTELYTKLKKYPRRFWALIFLINIIGITMTSLIFTCIINNLSWPTLIIPSLLVLGLLAIYPHTEEWEYIAWQSVSEKREQTFYD